MTPPAAPDCVLANAGFTSCATSFPDMTSERYHQLINTNLHGAFYTLREWTRHMRGSAQAGDPGGSIVVCGSLSSFHGLQGMEGIIKRFAAITPLGRPGYPTDIEGPAAYLASHASIFHTGYILVVEGGRTGNPSDAYQSSREWRKG